MFILKFFKIFFRNKWKEIKGFFHTRKWYNVLEILIIIGVVFLAGCICYGTGYLLVELGWASITADGEPANGVAPYTAIGIVFWLGMLILGAAGYGLWHFTKWIWINIKMAWIEAKGA